MASIIVNVRSVVMKKALNALPLGCCLVVMMDKINVRPKIGITASACCSRPAITINAKPPIIPHKGMAT